MDRIAFLFPGQGSQVAGMGRDFAADFPETACPIFEEADRTVGFPLSKLCFEGGPDELLDTSAAQPAIFVTSLVAAVILEECGVTPMVAAGHSLGEYNALVCAGVLEWRDALRLVRRRGELMASVNERTPGGMAAVIGLPVSRVESICAEASRVSGHTVEVANHNSASQTVISGAKAAISLAVALARESAAQHVAVLRTGAPFHSSLMADIEEEFARELDTVRFGTPRIPVVSTVTARYVRSGDEARRLLRRQLSAPVRWHETTSALADGEVTAFVEVGPGRVLTNINRGAHPRTPAMAAGTSERIRGVCKRLAAPAARSGESKAGESRA
ncbi:ACP S-malonyltransferase [Streptomyces macrosporus]|uniref:Malonyl CoA-acyl carrier protein transacylase n=1 Tax=Streptomyces macrosporus TaxID=44032 RepID=A0ABN3KLC9_9ACTN